MYKDDIGDQYIFPPISLFPCRSLSTPPPPEPICRKIGPRALKSIDGPHPLDHTRPHR